MPNLKRLQSLEDEPALIAYYCRKCEAVVKAVSRGGKQKYSFKCPECSGDCFYGTARSIIHFLRIKEHSDNGQKLLQIQQDKIKSYAEKNTTKA